MTGVVIVCDCSGDIRHYCDCQNSHCRAAAEPFVVERLGRYRGTFNAGFYILWHLSTLFVTGHSLKEVALDISEQICITADNVQVGVDGVLYYKIVDPQRASYGVAHFFSPLYSLLRRR